LRLAAGVDLGASGAIALVEIDRPRVFHVGFIPTITRTINGKPRKRIDYFNLRVTIDWLADFGVELWTLEQPGAGFGAGGRALGEHIGAFEANLERVQARCEWISPGAWKKHLKVPADKKEAVLRAYQLFPSDREKLKGSKGGRADGKAEAAMIGLYGIGKFINA